MHRGQVITRRAVYRSGCRNVGQDLGPGEKEASTHVGLLVAMERDIEL